MQLGLGLSLTNSGSGAGGGGVLGVAPSLDLQFATDKTLTARRGPTPVFARSSVGSYYTAAGLVAVASNDVARFDHNPSTLASRGLLIEEPRTNLVTRSQALTGWTSTNCTTSVSGTSPDGTANALLFNEGTAASVSHYAFPPAFSVTNVQAVVSCFVKAGTARYIGLRACPTTAAIYPWIVLDTQTGTLNANAAVTSSGVQTLSNGWYRIWLISTPQAASAAPVIAASNSATAPIQTVSTGPTFTGASLTFQFWGLQHEVGSFLTSYIPTAGASVARATDDVTISGAAFTGMHNASASTMLIDVDSSGMPAALTGNRSIAMLSNGAAYTNQYGFLKEAAVDRFVGFSNGATLGTFTNSSVGRRKAALALQSGSIALSVNGGAISTDAGAFSTVDRLSFRDVTNLAAGQPTCHIASFRYYKLRLPNAKLQSLTA